MHQIQDIKIESMKSSNSHRYHKDAIYLIGRWVWDWGDQATYVLQQAYHTTRCGS